MMGEVPESVENLTEDETAHFERCKTWIQYGNAYSMMQASRPGTIGLVLSSSPLALLGWYVQLLIISLWKLQMVDMTLSGLVRS